MASTSSSTDGYTLLKTITLPGTAGGHGDWTTFDPDTQTVWLSQSPDHNVVVLDANTNQVKGVIPDIANGNGIALTPQYAFLSDNQTGDTVIVDKRTLQTVGTVTPVGTGPNGTTYVPSTNEVFVSTDSNDMTAFSATAPFAQGSHFRLQPDPSPGGPDVALYVPAKDLLYQPDGPAVDVIDPHTHTIVDVWHPGIQGSTKPLVYDPVTNRFILGTTDNQMLVLDGNTGQKISAIPVQGAVDETAIDVAARLAFVGDKAGVIEMINLDTDQVVGTLPSEKNVHSLAVDPVNHEVFVYRNESNEVDVFAPAVTANNVTVLVNNGTINAGNNGAVTVLVNNGTINAGNANQVAFLGGTLDIGPTSPAAQVVRLYNAVLGRNPDAGGLALSTTQNAMSNGLSLRDVAQGMVSSAEFTRNYGSLAASQFVTALCQDFLGRAPDAAGLSNNLAALGNGATKAAVVLGISQSAERLTMHAGTQGIVLNSNSA